MENASQQELGSLVSKCCWQRGYQERKFPNPTPLLPCVSSLNSLLAKGNFKSKHRWIYWHSSYSQRPPSSLKVYGLGLTVSPLLQTDGEGKKGWAMETKGSESSPPYPDQVLSDEEILLAPSAETSCWSLQHLFSSFPLPFHDSSYEADPSSRYGRCRFH